MHSSNEHPVKVLKSRRIKPSWQSATGLLARVANPGLTRVLCKYNFILPASGQVCFHLFLFLFLKGTMSSEHTALEAKLWPLFSYQSVTCQNPLWFLVHCFTLATAPLVSTSSCHHFSNSTELNLLVLFSSFIKKTLETHPQLKMGINPDPLQSCFLLQME